MIPLLNILLLSSTILCPNQSDVLLFNEYFNLSSNDLVQNAENAKLVFLFDYDILNYGFGDDDLEITFDFYARDDEIAIEEYIYSLHLEDEFYYIGECYHFGLGNFFNDLKEIIRYQYQITDFNFLTEEFQLRFYLISNTFSDLPEEYLHYSLSLELTNVNTYSDGYAAGYEQGKEEVDTEQYELGYNNGYSDGYNTGYVEGANTPVEYQGVMGFFRSIFSIVDDVLSVEIFPHIKLYYVIGLPVVFWLLSFIIKWFI